jgi:aspartyl-tRNA(Asn)/glutamyl-tRNA(Gln) amidotransferase subunit B
MKYEPVIGLEVHAQLLTKTKVFCTCPTTFGSGPNTQCCPVCMGLPGALPVLNRRVVEFAIRAALAVGCEIHHESIFARKNYFYPDLPKGYQISQFDRPLATDGTLLIDTEAGEKRIRIKRIHLEEDAGKNLHDVSETTSLVDFNRSGVPLIEIVSEPDLTSTAEAAAYLKSLRQILMYLEICDGNMEEGSLRCDANISLRPVGEAGLRTKAELKNMNSFRFIERALQCEIDRQTAVYDAGGAIAAETLLYDQKENVTRPMRSKEEAHDYRYFPEPDLHPLKVSDEWIGEIRASQPELPRERARRFVSQYGLPRYDAEVLTGERELADYFESCVRIHEDPKSISNWIMTELLRELGREKMPVAKCPVPPRHMAGLLKLVSAGEISGKMAKEVFAEMYRTGGDAAAIVKAKGLRQVTDSSELESLVEGVIKANPKQVEKYLAGNDKMLGFFMGEVMKASKGKANPGVTQEILKRKLGK